MTDQATAALQHGQAIRLARAAERRRVAALPRPDGMRDMARLIDNPPPHMATLKALDALRWPTRCGHAYAVRVLKTVRIGEGMKLRDLTPRQRADLCLCLTGHERDVAVESEIREWVARVAA